MLTQEAGEVPADGWIADEGQPHFMNACRLRSLRIAFKVHLWEEAFDDEFFDFLFGECGRQRGCHH